MLVRARRPSSRPTCLSEHPGGRGPDQAPTRSPLHSSGRAGRQGPPGRGSAAASADVGVRARPRCEDLCGRGARGGGQDHGPRPMGAADAGGRRLVPGGPGLRRPGARPAGGPRGGCPFRRSPTPPGQSTGTPSWRCASGVTPLWSSWSTTSTSSPPWVSDACSSGCCWRRTTECTSWSAAGRRPRVNMARTELASEVVGPADLRFRPAETLDLFRDCYDLPLSDPDARVLTRRTGGWAAALHLFHHTVAGRAAEVRHRSVRVLGRRDDYAREYLAQTVPRRARRRRPAASCGAPRPSRRSPATSATACSAPAAARTGSSTSAAAASSSPPRPGPGSACRRWCAPICSRRCGTSSVTR